MGARGSRDRSHVDRLDPLPVAHEFLERKAMDGQTREGPHDRASRFEAQREDPDQEVASRRELGIGHRFGAHPLQFGKRVHDGRDRDLGVDGGTGTERARPTAHVEAGAGAVGVALRLAQLHVQPRIEQAAQDGAHDRHGVEIRDRPGQARIADPDLGLHAARPMHDADQPTGPGRAVVHPRPRPASRARCRGGPRAEQSLHDRDDILPAEVAGHDECGHGRVDDPGMRRGEDVAVQSLDRIARAARRPVVGRGRRIDRADERLLHAPAGIRLGLEQVVETLVAQALHLACREGGSQQELGEELQGGLEAARGHVHSGTQRVPAGVGVERRTQALGGFGQGDRVVVFRALAHRPRRHDGRPGHVGRFIGGARGQDDRGRHQRSARQIGDEDRQAVGQARAGDRRKFVGARCPGLGTIDHDVAVSARLGPRAHAATSSSSLSAPLSVPGSPVAASSTLAESAGGSSGRYVSTSRLSARNVAAATSMIASGVTAR